MYVYYITHIYTVAGNIKKDDPANSVLLLLSTRPLPGGAGLGSWAPAATISNSLQLAPQPLAHLSLEPVVPSVL